MRIDLIYLFLVLVSFGAKIFIGGPIFEAAFYSMVGMFIIGLFYMMYYYRNIDLEISLENDKIRVFQKGKYKIKIKNKGILFVPFIEIKDEEKKYGLFGIKRKKEVYYNIKAQFDERGIYKNKIIEIEIKDPFNIFTLRKTKILSQITVYPILYEKIRLVNLSKNKANLGLLKSYDIDNIRKYNLGDDIRNINWKIFAKTGDMYVVENKNENYVSTVIIVDMDRNNNEYIVGRENKERNLEEYLVGFALSLSKYFIKNDLQHKMEINNNIFKNLDIKKEGDIHLLENYLASNSSNGDLALGEYLKIKEKTLYTFSFIILIIKDVRSLNLNIISKLFKNSLIHIYTFNEDNKVEKPRNININSIGEIIDEN